MNIIRFAAKAVFSAALVFFVYFLWFAFKTAIMALKHAPALPDFNWYMPLICSVLIILAAAISPSWREEWYLPMDKWGAESEGKR